MKRTLIGGILFFSGVIAVLGIIISAAAIYSPSITSWSGSKLWYAIFGAKQFGSEVVQSLFLGGPFIIGTIVGLLGLIILGKEYFDNK